MRVAVTGGCNYADRQRVYDTLDDIGITLLIHGAARGADTLAADWAAARGIPVRDYPADWSNIDVAPCLIKVRGGRPYNALAGLNRNTVMLEAERPDLLIVFPGGAGTADCHLKALKRDIPSLEVEP